MLNSRTCHTRTSYEFIDLQCHLSSFCGPCCLPSFLLPPPSRRLLLLPSLSPLFSSLLFSIQSSPSSVRSIRAAAKPIYPSVRPSVHRHAATAPVAAVGAAVAVGCCCSFRFFSSWPFRLSSMIRPSVRRSVCPFFLSVGRPYCHPPTVVQTGR